MAELREVVTSLGHTGVSTYIQSGNVLFTTAEDDTAKLASALEAAITGRSACSLRRGPVPGRAGPDPGPQPVPGRAEPETRARGVPERRAAARPARPHQGRGERSRGQGQPRHRHRDRPGPVPAHAGRLRHQRAGPGAVPHHRHAGQDRASPRRPGTGPRPPSCCPCARRSDRARRAVLVTGASRGIGRAVAQAFAAPGRPGGGPPPRFRRAGPGGAGRAARRRPHGRPRRPGRRREPSGRWSIRPPPTWAGWTSW